MLAYGPIILPNVEIFKHQMQGFKTLLMRCPPSKEQARDMDFLLPLGELFSLVAYGQLILEQAAIETVDDGLIDQVFDVMVRDFSRHALALYSCKATTPDQGDRALELIRRPAHDLVRFAAVWRGSILPLVDAYRMNAG
jgi:acyl-CoA dehydrogenase